jgi:hypothetical protein
MLHLLISYHQLDMLFPQLNELQLLLVEGCPELQQLQA